MSVFIPSPYSIAHNSITMPVSHSSTFTGVWARESDNILQQKAFEGVDTLEKLIVWADTYEEIFDDSDYANTPPLFYELHWRGEWYKCPVDPVPSHFDPDKWRRNYPCKVRCRRLWLVQNCQILPYNDAHNERYYLDFSKASQLWLAPFADFAPDRSLEYTRPYSTPYGDLEGFSFEEVEADWGHEFLNIAKPTGHLRQKIANSLIDAGTIPSAWNIENPFLVCGVKFYQPYKWIPTHDGGQRKAPDEDEEIDTEYVTNNPPDSYIYWNGPASPAEGGWASIASDSGKGNYLYERLCDDYGHSLKDRLGVGKAFDFKALVTNYYWYTCEKPYGSQGFDPSTKHKDFRANRFEFSFRQLKEIQPQ